MKALILLFYVLYGLIIGSFLNVCIYRIPLGISVVKGRSYCPRCQHTLKPYDMVPVLSYLVLGRKCRNCKEPISPRYALVELLTGLLFGLCFLAFGLTAMSVVACLAGAILVVIGFIDFDTQTIPDGANLLLLLLGIASMFLPPHLPLASHIGGALVISAPMLLLAYCTNGFGGGDIKLFAAGGLLVGFGGAILSFLLAAILGGIYGIYLLLVKKASRKDSFPFGAFIGFGLFISLLYGQEIVLWYLGLIGI